MKSIMIIYWSGTGNTQKMAVAVAEGAKIDDTEVKILTVDAAAQENVLKADGIALGCPAMGSEVLEESEMEPFVASLAGAKLAGKPLALFGSYDWGDGQWMRDWQECMETAGAKMVADGLIFHNTPDETGLAGCRELGKKLVAMVL
ncbi:MAG TPA: flavodoxin [Firmicutes bacterium]|jgi:flavodoxin I|nr:flavodoxin [Bacillota bacterium]